MTADKPSFSAHFADPELVARYPEGPPRYVPGFDALHRMPALLLAEAAPAEQHVLVLGGGGGLELRSLGQAQPGWRFTAVDPSGPMLALARQIVGEVAERTTFIEGLIDDAPPGPFDAASCLLTLHFLPPADRQPTLRAMRRRLTPGAPLVVAHSSFPQAGRDRWLDRYQAFALSSGAPEEEVASAREAVAASVHLLEPSDDELLLRQAGFKDVELFYAAFTWRGWVARA